MSMKSMVRVVCGLAVAALVLGSAFKVEARPNYMKDFSDMYPDVKEASTAKCGVCHVGKPADKKWNDYGEAMGKALGAKNVKKADDVKASLKKIEGEKSGTDGKTFGDLLKDGKLPGK